MKKVKEYPKLFCKNSKTADCPLDYGTCWNYKAEMKHRKILYCDHWEGEEKVVKQVTVRKDIYNCK